jgi:hypothetical protein
MIRARAGPLCALVVCVLVFGCAQASVLSPSQKAARFESEFSRSEHQQLRRVSSGLSAGERSEITTLAAELYDADQQRRPSDRASPNAICQDADDRTNLAGEAVLAFHNFPIEGDENYPNAGETRALLAMRFYCPDDTELRNDIIALVQHRMTWGERRRALLEGNRNLLKLLLDRAKRAAP